MFKPKMLASAVAAALSSMLVAPLAIADELDDSTVGASADDLEVIVVSG